MIEAPSATEIRHDLAKGIQSNSSLIVVFFQRRPYTIAVANVNICSTTYQGVGISKVSGKDWYNPKLGKRIALGRAIDCIARQTLGENAEWKQEFAGAEGTIDVFAVISRMEGL